MNKSIVVNQTVADRDAAQCDLCRAPHPTLLYPCRQFMMTLVSPDGPHTQDFNSDGWAICADCAPLVDRADVEGTVARFLANSAPLDGYNDEERAYVTNLIRKIHANFQYHRYGDPIPYRPAL